MEQSSLLKMLGVECVILVHTVSIIFAINVFLSNILSIMFLKQRPHGCFNHSRSLYNVYSIHSNRPCVLVWL